jgi:hypothetical protein
MKGERSAEVELFEKVRRDRRDQDLSIRALANKYCSPSRG